MMTNCKINAVLVAVISLIITPYGAVSQTGPGGVGTPTTVAYWLDVETNGGSNGTFVSSIKDFSAAGIDAVQANASKQPVYQTNIVNGRSALFFDGTKEMLSPASLLLDGAQYLEYYMFASVGYTGDRSPLTFDYGTAGFEVFAGFRMRQGNLRAFTRDLASGSLARSRIVGNPVGFNLFQGRKTSAELITTLNYATVNTATAITPTPAVHEGILFGGSSVGSGGIIGHIAEVFAFTAALNTAETKILQNYMSAKFNATIPALVDMYDFEVNHGLGVIGIGRDNAANEHSNSIGNGIVRIQKTGMADGQYLFIGNDGTPLSQRVTTVPPILAGGERFERVWRMDEPADIGAIDIVFDLDATNDFSADSSNYRLLISGTSDFTGGSGIVTVETGIYNDLDQTVTFSNVDMNAGDFFTLGGDAPAIIESIGPGLYNARGTWNCNCIPKVLNNVTVLTGHTVIINGPSFAQNLNVQTGAVLTWSAGAVVEVTGNLSLDDGLILGSSFGEVIFSGETAQTIDLNSDNYTIRALTIDNNAGVSLANGGFTITELFSPLNGDFDITLGDPVTSGLTIISTSATTGARVSAMGPNGSVTGDVVIQRFLPGGVAGNRNLASPVIGADLSQWDDDLLISGTGFPDGCAWGTTPTSSGCYFSVKKFLGGLDLTNFSDVTNPNEPLTNMDGFELFLGDDLTSFGGETINTRGSLNGPVDLQLLNAPRNWNLIGNPYAAPINYQLLDKLRFSQFFYVFDAASGSYQWYDGTNNTSSITDLSNGSIAMGQGFWVVTGVPNSLTFKQSAKITTNAVFVRDTEVENGLQLTLSQENSTYYNVSSLAFDESSVDGEDDHDINYLSTGLETASSLFMPVNDSVSLTKNYLEQNGLEKLVDFSMNCLTDGYYKISPSNLKNVKDYSNVYIFDKSLNKMIDLKKEGSYTFYAREGIADRFTVILNNSTLSDKTYISGATDDLNNAIAITQLGHTLELIASEGLDNGSVSVTNIVGQTIISDFRLDNTTSKQYLTIDNNQNGIFIVVVRSGGQIVATKKIIL